MSPHRYEVAVIGPGRVGTTLAAGLVRAGHRVVAVSGRGAASIEAFTARVAGARRETDPAAAARRATLVLVTTPDDAVEPVVSAIAVADGFRDGQHVIHTSGSLGLAPLRRAALAGARIAACHPAQTFPAGVVDPDALLGTAWAVTAAPPDRVWATDLVEQLGGTPHQVADGDRVLYHAGLALAANAVGAAVAAARQLLMSARIDDPAAFLRPLTAASIDHVLTRGAQAITGPVVRGDAGTLARHLERLDADAPRLAEVYRALTNAILAEVRPALSRDQIDDIERVLG